MKVVCKDFLKCQEKTKSESQCTRTGGYPFITCCASLSRSFHADFKGYSVGVETILEIMETIPYFKYLVQKAKDKNVHMQGV